MKTIFHRILATTALCLAAVACNSHTEAATQLKGNTYYQRSSVSMGDLYRLPFVYDDSETIKKSYDAITFQAVYSAGTLTVTIKNTGEKDIILRSTGGTHKATPNTILCDTRKKERSSFFTR